MSLKEMDRVSTGQLSQSQLPSYTCLSVSENVLRQHQLNVSMSSFSCCAESYLVALHFPPPPCLWRQTTGLTDAVLPFFSVLSAVFPFNIYAGHNYFSTIGFFTTRVNFEKTMASSQCFSLLLKGTIKITAQLVLAAEGLFLQPGFAFQPGWQIVINR